MLQEGNSAKVYRTTDGGGNWSQFGLGTPNWVGRMRFATADSGWACGSQGTMRFTSNGGASWSAQNLNSSAYCEDVFMLDSKQGWTAGGYGGGSGFIRHTTNGGQNWETQTPAQGDHFNRIHFLDSQRGWMGVYGGLVHGTTDGGTTWQILGSVPHFYFEDILFVDENTGWAAAGNAGGQQPGEDGRGFVYKTTNGGISWTQEYRSSLPRGWVQDLDMQPGGTLWACGNHAGLIKSVGAQWVEERLMPDASRLTLSAVPNPVATSARMLYGLPRPGNVTLTVFDATGRQVAALVDGFRPAGRHTATWSDDAGNGVYFVRLVAGGEQTSTKLNRQQR
jgi:photosystem II stability/assembly factor-like uncharacterized protein